MLLLNMGFNQTVARSQMVNGAQSATFAPMEIEIRDFSSKPIPGTPILWKVGAHPANMTCVLGPNMGTDFTDITDVNGRSQLGKGGNVSAIVSGAEGQCQIIATATAYNRSAPFNLNAIAGATTAGPPAAPSALSIVSGDNQTVARNQLLPGAGIPAALFAPLAVVAKDASGKPIPGAVVIFSIGAKPNAMACQMAIPNGTVTADANGIATLTAPTGAPAPVFAYYADGECQVIVSAGPVTATFHLNVAGASGPTGQTAASLSLMSGDNQVSTRSGTNIFGGEAYYAPLVVRANDAAGKPIPGALITWKLGNKPAAMACQFEPSGINPGFTYADASGIATMNKMSGNSARIYYADGDCEIVATSGSAAPVTFHLRSSVPGPPTLAIVSGDNQNASRMGTNIQGGEAFYTPLTVVLRDWTGKPLAKTPVIFSLGTKPGAMACQFEPGGDAQSTIVTDDNGTATLGKMSNTTGSYSARIYYADGQCQIIATSGAASVTFHLNSVPPKMLMVSGDNQTASPKTITDSPWSNSGIPTALFSPLVVKLIDANGNPLVNAPIVWAVGTKPAAMACQIEPAGASQSTVMTDASGSATLNKMGGSPAFIYYAAGQCQITAAFNGTVATFHLNAQP